MRFNKDKAIGTAKKTGVSLAWLGIGILTLVVGLLIISAVHAVSPGTDVTGITLGVLATCITASFYGVFKL